MGCQELGFISKGMHDKTHILEMLKNVWRADGKKVKYFPDF
jgi:hypothetical protein